jgi:hypothetical protein
MRPIAREACSISQNATPGNASHARARGACPFLTDRMNEQLFSELSAWVTQAGLTGLGTDA